VRVLCWRDTDVKVPGTGRWRSRVGVVEQQVVEGGVEGSVGETEVKAKVEDGKEWTAVGWEKTAKGKLAPRVADLAPMMDPTRYASCFFLTSCFFLSPAPTDDRR
jgi:ubiquitin-like modifier-activating enzyme ATG7